MTGNPEPLRLYTIDVDPSRVLLEEEAPYLTLKQMKILRVN
jgi:hypothetical protein